MPVTQTKNAKREEEMRIFRSWSHFMMLEHLPEDETDHRHDGRSPSVIGSSFQPGCRLREIAHEPFMEYRRHHRKNLFLEDLPALDGIILLCPFDALVDLSQMFILKSDLSASPAQLSIDRDAYPDRYAAWFVALDKESAYTLRIWNPFDQSTCLGEWNNSV